MVHSQVHQRVCIFACCGSARTFVAARSKERSGATGDAVSVSVSVRRGCRCATGDTMSASV